MDIQNQLHMHDSYLKEFDSTVSHVVQDAAGIWVALDQTAFYPLSGGQPFDTGLLTHEGKTWIVSEVRKADGMILHRVDHDGLTTGNRVHGIIDWNRRYKLMRMHTAAHIVSGIAHQEYGAQITGNQLDLDKSRVDFSLETFDRDVLSGLQQKANAVIARNLPISAVIMPRAEAEKIPALVKLAKGLDPTIQQVRVLSIGDFDSQADGGTHVKNTSEIGGIEVFDLENKGKGRKRMYFRLVDGETR
jgi:misacylated tRNA(Ala) deacylase